VSEVKDWILPDLGRYTMELELKPAADHGAPVGKANRKMEAGQEEITALQNKADPEGMTRRENLKEDIETTLKSF
jgi:hypothetical protein